MIVLDASVVVELLTNSDRAGSIRRDLDAAGGSFLAPQLIDVEVLNALRRLNATKLHGDPIADLAALPVARYPHAPLLHRIWELRHNFTAYDAAYIALAEAANAILYTCDEKLQKGHRAQVRLFNA